MVPHWTWSVCPLWLKPHSWEPGCPRPAAAGLVHTGGWTLWAGRSLNRHGLAHLPPSPSFLRVTPLADNSIPGRLGICLRWGSEEWWEVMRHKPQESVLAHSTTIYNPRTGLALSFVAPRASGARRNAAALWPFCVTTLKLGLRGWTSHSQGPRDCKWLLPSRNNFGVKIE